nr:hypothetical protein [uncultured Cohaesibacter sp.]
MPWVLNGDPMGPAASFFRANSIPGGSSRVLDEVDFALSISEMKKTKIIFGGSLWLFLSDLKRTMDCCCLTKWSHLSGLLFSYDQISCSPSGAEYCGFPGEYFALFCFQKLPFEDRLKISR